MKTLTFHTTINAPRQNVWDTMLSPSGYPEWSWLFNPYGCSYEGSWEQGAHIDFIGPDEHGKKGGVHSMVAENRLHEYVSLKHLQDFYDGKPANADPNSSWANAFENYTFTDVDGSTKVTVDINVPDDFVDSMSAAWPRALARLKILCEAPGSITVATRVHAPLDQVWHAWTDPVEITHWNFASDDWESIAGTNDVKVGGRFCATMAAKDKSAQFDFTGTYLEVIPQQLLRYMIDDGRMVKVTFASDGSEVVVTETFQMEQENSRELQQAGWQSILNNFKKYVETKK